MAGIIFIFANVKYKNRKIMEFKQYFDTIMKEVRGLNFGNETYIRMLYDEDVPIERAIIAIKNGN